MSFRSKLLLSMLLVVAAITGATLLATQQKVKTAYERIFEQQFQSELDYFTRLQESRLKPVREISLNFTRGVRLFAAMEEYQSNPTEESVKIIYENLDAELQVRKIDLPFARVLDKRGAVINPSGTNELTDLVPQLKVISKAMEDQEKQQTGYLAPASGSSLFEVVFTKILDATTEEVTGAVVLGFPMLDFAGHAGAQLQSGIFFGNVIYSEHIPKDIRPTIAESIQTNLTESEKNEGRFEMTFNNVPHRMFYRLLNPGTDFPPAYQVSVYSLEEPIRVQRELRSQILLFGGLAIVGALALSLVLSHGLSAPINQLVAGTHAVEKGDFNVRVPIRSNDEIGALAKSFNQMTEGLALKEKYRSVLDKVSDPRIAQKLVEGKIALGGEERHVSALFCDIRGFTGLTQNMAPEEVIQMLNEHFTPLANVVQANNGAVDKFVGDLIMAIFGAPSENNDPVLALKCAVQMIEERTKQNATSKYKISVGIGIATGKALAGCMGSENRLNYTVLGPRVNLASRLCGQAGRMEIVIDETTYQACKDVVNVEPLPELKLKGFSDPIQAYKVTALRTP